MDTELTYNSAIEELNSIARKMESPDLNLSLVVADVKRAKYLVSWCREYLRGVKEDLDKALEEEPSER